MLNIIVTFGFDMERITFDLTRFETRKPAPHQLAAEAERLCEMIGCKFNTAMLRMLKIDGFLAQEVAHYMKDRGISSINYFTKVFYAQRKERAQRAQ